jgi:hypothetical protein
MLFNTKVKSTTDRYGVPELAYIKGFPDDFDCRISNEVKTKSVEHLIPFIIKQAKGTDLLAVGPGIGFYLAPFMRAKNILMVDRNYLIIRFNIIYKAFLSFLAENKKTLRPLSDVKKNIDFKFWRENLERHLTIDEKSLLQNKQKIDRTKHPSHRFPALPLEHFIENEEILSLFKNYEYHSGLSENYLTNQESQKHLLKLIHNNRIHFLIAGIGSENFQKWSTTHALLFSFSTFYLSYRQQTQNFGSSQEIAAIKKLLPLSKKVIFIESEETEEHFRYHITVKK